MPEYNIKNKYTFGVLSGVLCLLSAALLLAAVIRLEYDLLFAVFGAIAMVSAALSAVFSRLQRRKCHFALSEAAFYAGLAEILLEGVLLVICMILAVLNA